MFSEGLEEKRLEAAEYALQQSIFTVVRRTDPPFDVFPRRRLARFDLCNPGRLGASEAVFERSSVARMGESGRDVVKQHRERVHARVIESPRLAQKDLNRLGIAEAATFARVKAVDEIDTMLLRGADEPRHIAPVRRRVGETPALAMIRIVFRRIEIRVHAARGAEGEKASPMRHRPERPEKSFDDAAPAKAGGSFHAGRI